MKSSIHQQKGHWWLSSKRFFYLASDPTPPDSQLKSIQVKSAAETSMARGVGRSLFWELKKMDVRWVGEGGAWHQDPREKQMIN